MTWPRPRPRIVPAVEWSRPLALLVLAACGALLAGCSRTCEGSPRGTLRVVNGALSEGPLVVRVAVFRDEVLPLAERDDVLFPGEAVRFDLFADRYTVVIDWDGGATSSHEIDVDRTPTGYAVDLGWLFGDDEDPDEDGFDDGGHLPDCPLKVTELKVSPPMDGV